MVARCVFFAANTRKLESLLVILYGLNQDTILSRGELTMLSEKIAEIVSVTETAGTGDALDRHVGIRQKLFCLFQP